MVANAIVPMDVDGAVDGVRQLAMIVRRLRESVFVQGQDFGVIPGTGTKEVLLLPGMEKLCRALRLRPEYELVTEIQDFDKPLFFYRYKCSLFEVDTGLMLTSAIGSANSMESKWAWRWVQRHEVPPHLDADTLVRRGGRSSEFAFAIDKAETTGKYGKPAEYWQQFRDAIEANTATRVMKPTRNGQSEAWEIDMTLFRVPNPDICDQVNTIDKIAQKRSLGSAIKGAANVSELFTIDLEDMPEFNVIVTKPLPDDAIEGEFTDQTTPAAIVTDVNQIAKRRLDNAEPRRVGAVGGKAESKDEALARPWTVETLKPSVIELFDNEHNYYAAIKNYRDAAHAEYLLPAETSLAEAEARVRFYRSRTGKAEQHVFEDARLREAFIGACVDIAESDRGIVEALDAVTDYPVGSLTAWRGDKATAWAAVLAAGGLYVVRAATPESAGAVTRALVLLICEHVTGLNASEGESKKHVAFEEI